MSRKYKPSWVRYRTSGFTLIEVLAGLALLGTLLVSILVAKNQYMRQARLANRTVEACTAADALLGTWWEHPETMPRFGSGDVDGSNTLQWRVDRVSAPEVDERFDADVVRLEVYELVGEAEVVLVEIDVIAPRPVPDKDGAKDATVIEQDGTSQPISETD